MRWNYEFKVGLFALAAIAVISYMFFVLSPDMFRNGEEHHFYTLIDDASGIVTKTQVKTSGVVIGKVTEVKLYKNQSRIDFVIQGDTKLPRGSEIMIKEKGLLGDVFLEIIRGDDNGEYLENGEFLAPAQDQVSLSKLLKVASSIGKDIKKITETFADVVGGDDGKKNVGSIITNIRDVAGMLKGILSENRDDLKTIMTNLRNLTGSLDSVASGRKSDLGEIVTNFRDLSAGLKDVLRPDNRERFDRILASLDTTVDNAKNISDKINKGEGTLGRLVNDDKMIEEFQGAVSDLHSLLAPATKMQVAVDFHAEYKGNARTQGFFSVMLQPRPDKYYLLGITDVVENEKETFVEQVPTESGETSSDALKAERYNERTVERKSLRFNIQYAQRWYFAQMRFGLFYTTGGLASDFFLLNDRVRLSFEAFDFRRTKKRNFAHLKTYASILFFNHIYAMVGADDLTRKDEINGKKKDPFYFMGAGFQFSDEDLKGLFGLASRTL